MKKFFAKVKSLFWGDEKIKGGSALFITMIVISTAALLISNVIANKLIPLFGWTVNGQAVTLTCGVLCFPLTYVTSDIFSHVYGYSASRRATWIAFAANVLMVFLFCMADLLPAASAVYGQTAYAESFHTVLGIDFSPNPNSPIGAWGPFGVLVASLVAFIVGSWVDDLVFEGIRKITTKKNQAENKGNLGKFILKAVGSSFAGELVDSIIFIPLMYFFNGIIGYYSFGTVCIMILIQVMIKTCYELVISPLTYVIAEKARKYELAHLHDEHAIAAD